MGFLFANIVFLRLEVRILRIQSLLIGSTQRWCISIFVYCALYKEIWDKRFKKFIVMLIDFRYHVYHINRHDGIANHSITKVIK